MKGVELYDQYPLTLIELAVAESMRERKLCHSHSLTRKLSHLRSLTCMTQEQQTTADA